MKIIFYFFLILLLSISTTAQTINLEFPYFAGQTYDFTIFQGEKRITLTQDTIPKGGKVQLIIPDEYKGYKGIAQWYLTNSATGGGLDLIINNEDFSVACFDPVPTAESIVYKNTTENVIDKANYKKQQQLFEKHDAMLATTRAYNSKSKIHKLAAQEYTSIIKQYKTYSSDLSQSAMYAAKFRQIVNLTLGIGTIITLDEKEKAKNISSFITSDLDFEVLYTSNHWVGIINSWVQVHALVIKDDSEMISNARTIFSRIKSDKIYTDFVVTLTKELSKAGKYNVLSELEVNIKEANRLVNYDGVLRRYQKDIASQNKKAPDLILTNPDDEGPLPNMYIVKSEDFATEIYTKTLLIFYETGCGHCETLMAQLPQYYETLEQKGIRIISISSDIDKDVFEKAAAIYPWVDKYCDFEGFEGINFKNYGIYGTPTIYLISKDGIVTKEMATFEDIVYHTK